KVEVPMIFWLLLTVLATLRLRRTGRVRDAATMFVLAGYTASTQYSGAIAVVGAAIALGQSRLVLTGRRVAWLAVAVAGGFLFGTPYALLNPPNFYAGLKLDATINHEGVSYTPARPPAFVDYPIHVLPYSATLPLLLLGVVGIALASRQGRRLWPVWGLLVANYL